MSNLEWFFLVVLAIAAIPYIGGPLLILGTFKLRCPARILYFDPDTLRLPRDVAEFLEPAREQLVALGFRPVAYFCLPELVANVKSINVLFINAETADGAMLNCIYGDARGPTLIKTKYVEFLTRFRDGVSVQTNNSPEVGAFRAKPGDHTIQFWDSEDVAELYGRHEEISDRLGSAPRSFRFAEEFGSDVEHYIQAAAIKEAADYQVEVGLFRPVRDGYRPTLRGAFVLTWQELWPWKYLRRQARRREARRWLHEIGSA